MRIIIGIILIVLNIHLTANEYTFDALTTKNGLSHNEVLDIFQDSYGFIWFATIDGLNRYDGYEFRTFHVDLDNKNSLSSDMVICIAEDQNKNLWIGTLSHGLSIFDMINEKFTHIKNTEKNPNNITSNNIRSVMCDSKNRVWVGTDRGLNCITASNDSYNIRKIEYVKNDPNGLSNHHVSSVYEDSKRQIWICNDNSIKLMVPDANGEVSNYFRTFIHNKGYWNIYNFIETAEGYVFTSQAGATLVKFDENNKILSLREIHNERAEKIIQDAKGNLWIGGHRGLYLYQYNFDIKPPYRMVKHFMPNQNRPTIKNQFIRSIMADNTGIVWIGTNGGGISKYSGKRNKFRHYTSSEESGSLSNNKVWAIYEDSRYNAWFCTEGGGINLLPAHELNNYNSGFKSFAVNPPGFQNFAFDVKELTLKDNMVLWVGTGYKSKLVQITHEYNRWRVSGIDHLVQQHVMCLFEDCNRTVWIGTYGGGVVKYVPNEAGGRWVSYNKTNSLLPSDVIRYITEDSKGRLWISTSDGLALLTADQIVSEAPEFVVFKHDPQDTTSISHSYSMQVVESSDSTIWVGTFGGGLNRYIEGSTLSNGSFSRITTNDGLPNNVIKSIIEDNDGMLWITSNKGLSRYNPYNNNIRNFDTFDGLQDMTFTDMSGLKRHDGEILIGGVNGFNAFYPKEISEDTLVPQLAFTYLEIFNQTIQVGEIINKRVILNRALNETKSITLRHHENDFSIHFTSLSYAAPQKNLFRYKLDGYDKNWHTVSGERRFSKYTQLKPGNYTFKFTASNSDGFWNKNYKELHIRIHSPYWETWWFRIVIILFLITLVIVIFNIRTRQMRIRNEELEQEVKIRTSEIQQKNKMLNENTARIEEQAEELRTQRDSLEEANLVKNKLFSIVAHDLKDPLNTLSGFLELLVLNYAEYSDQERQKMIGRALDSTGNIKSLVLNLLQWARSQNNTIQFQPANTDVVKLVDKVFNLLAIRAKEKGVKLHYFKDKSVVMLVDADLIEFIVRNLLTNALKYTPRNGIIDVTCKTRNKELVIEVKDNGIGISKDNLSKLFRNDIHISTQGTENEQGTGIGLITCKVFAEMHGGTIQIESEEGKGTRVKVFIPSSV